MNTRGNPQNLIAAHPGNHNAVKEGVHSPKMIETRASEIVSELGISEVIDPIHQKAVMEYARISAIAEAIDRDLSKRGTSDRNGKGRYLVTLRERYGRLLSKLREEVRTAYVQAQMRKTAIAAAEIGLDDAEYQAELARLREERAEAEKEARLERIRDETMRIRESTF